MCCQNMESETRSQTFMFHTRSPLHYRRTFLVTEEFTDPVDFSIFPLPNSCEDPNAKKVGRTKEGTKMFRTIVSVSLVEIIRIFVVHL